MWTALASFYLTILGVIRQDLQNKQTPTTKRSLRRERHIITFAARKHKLFKYMLLPPPSILQPRSSLIVSRIHIWFLPEFLHNLRLNFKYIENYIFCYKAEDELQQCQVEFANQVWKIFEESFWEILKLSKIFHLTGWSCPEQDDSSESHSSGSPPTLDSVCSGPGQLMDQFVSLDRFIRISFSFLSATHHFLHNYLSSDQS